MDFVEKEGLTAEEGNLFSYLARVMKQARQLFDVTGIDAFATIERGVRARLSVVDERVLEELG
jgi:hypothetical protein